MQRNHHPSSRFPSRALPAAAPARSVRISIHIIIYLIAITMLLPFLWMLATALKTDAEAIGVGSQGMTFLPRGWPWQWQWGNFARAWRTAGLSRFYINSTVAAVAVTVLSVIHNALAGYAFARLRLRGGRMMYLIAIGTMMLPFQVYFIFSYWICAKLSYIDNYQALIVPFLASGFGIFYMRQAVSTIPDSLIDAARIDGLTDFEIFTHIVWPSVSQAVAALAIFTYMGSWNSFFWPLIVIDSGVMNTLPLAIKSLAGRYYTDSWPVQMAGAAIITLPTILVFLIFQRQFVEGITLTGMKD